MVKLKELNYYVSQLDIQRNYTKIHCEISKGRTLNGIGMLFVSLEGPGFKSSTHIKIRHDHTLEVTTIE